MKYTSGIWFLVCIFGIAEAVCQNLRPIKGKWNITNTRDYISIWHNNQNKGYLDGTGNGSIDAVTNLPAQNGDIPLTLDLEGDHRTEFALYRPGTHELIFYTDYSQSTSEHSRRTIGSDGDIIITGDWNGSGKDGFAVYHPGARQFEFYEEFDSPTPVSTVVTGNWGDIPLAGNWDGLNGDGFALYRPSTREIVFYSDCYQSQPYYHFQVGNHGDQVIVGDWNANGTDDVALFRQTSADQYEFWLYPWINGEPFQSIFLSASNYAIQDISSGRQFFYENKVPHVNFDGSFRDSYDEQASFFPKAIYNVVHEDLDIVSDAGYNLSHLNDTYFLSESIKSFLNSSGNQHRTILPFLPLGGSPFVGKFTATRDLPGFNDTNARIIYYDSNGDNLPDKIFKIGNPNDVAIAGDWNGDNLDEFALIRAKDQTIVYFLNVLTPYHFDTKPILAWTQPHPTDKVISGNWDGLAGDGYALYRPSLGELRFYQNYYDTEPYKMINIGGADDRIIAGDWDGDGVDGFALYNQVTREFRFFQSDNSNVPFASVVYGNSGDIPVAGDWDGDGTDGYGVYRTDPVRSRHEFWWLDQVNSNHTQVKSVFFGNPMLQNIDQKYVFGFYTFDEPQSENQYNDLPKEADWQQNYDYLAQIYSTYSALTPQVFFHANIGKQPTGIEGAYWQQFALLGEVTAHDDYPIHTYGMLAPYSADEIKSIASIGETVELARVTRNENVPNWFVPQAFTDLSGTGFRFFKPLPGHYKAMVYTSLIYGATGIFTFAYNNPDIPGVNGISPTHNSDLWIECKTVNGELDVLKPFLLSNTPDVPYKTYSLTSPAHDPIPVRTLLKYFDGYYLLLATNVTKQPVDIVIQLPSSLTPEDGSIERLFENSSLQIKGGAIKDSFDKFGVHVYKIRASQGPWTARQKVSLEEGVKSASETEYVNVHPNPTAQSATFRIAGPVGGQLTISIFDQVSRLVRTINTHKDDGAISIVWDLTNELGEPVQSGLYHYKIQLNDGSVKAGRLIVKK